MLRAAVGFVVVFALGFDFARAGSAQAQDVRWRTDYAAARKEATAAGRALLLDFGTETCVWCRKQDATTFRDRGVIDLMNTRVVPVKVDGNRDAWLTQAAGVQAFPTLVLISADGKVLARHEGYADVAKVTAMVRQAPAAEAPKPSGVLQAAGAPNSMGVVQAAAAVRSPAAELLTLARADHGSGRYLACIERCDRLIADHANSPEAGDARRLSAGITGDPEKWRRVTDQLQANLSALHKNLDTALGR